MLNMLAFSKPREPYLETIQVNEIVDDIVSLLQKSADDAKLVLLSELDAKNSADPGRSRWDSSGGSQPRDERDRSRPARGSGIVTVRTPRHGPIEPVMISVTGIQAGHSRSRPRAHL